MYGRRRHERRTAPRCPSGRRSTLASKLAGLPRYDPLTALISGLSPCLLLRTGDPALAVLTAAVAVASKFVLRVHPARSSA